MNKQEGQKITQMRITHLAAVISLYFGEKMPTASQINNLSRAIIDVDVDDDRVLEALAFIEENNGELDYNAEGFDIQSHLVKHFYLIELDPEGKKPNVNTFLLPFNDTVNASLRDKAWSIYGLEATVMFDKQVDEKNDKPKGKTKVIDKDQTVLIITSRGDRRCRAGQCFTKEPTEVVVADLEEGQLEILTADPELIIK